MQNNWSNVVCGETSDLKEKLRYRTKIKPPERLIEAMLAKVNGDLRDYNEAVECVKCEEWKAEMNAWIYQKTVDKFPIDGYTASNENQLGKDRYNARLKIHGFSHREGTDCNETLCTEYCSQRTAWKGSVSEWFY